MPAVLWFPGASGVTDPDPEATQARDVTLLVAAPENGGPYPVVGWGDGGLAALELAARRPDLVGRLVVVATPMAEPAGFEIGAVAAKTLLLYGAKDETAGPRHGKWWKQRIPDSRYEQVPGDGPLLIGAVWKRALSHLAPGGLRAGGRR